MFNGQIKCIFFDFDGVLTTDKYGSLSTFRHLSRSTGILETQLLEVFWPHYEDLVFGRKSHQDVWAAICRALNHEIPFAQLIEAFDSTPINQPMLELANELRRNYSVGIITDNPADRMQRISERHGFDSIFDPIVVSAELGLNKSTPDIFAKALEAAECEASQAIFVDNTAKNLDAPAALGMHAIFHDDERNDVQRLRELLIAEYGLAMLDNQGTSSSGHWLP